MKRYCLFIRYFGIVLRAANIVICLLLSTFLNAQEESEIVSFIHLEAFEVSAGLEDFDAEDFMRQVQTDTTFYQAFLNLKYFPHAIASQVKVFDKDSDELAWMNRSAIQHLNAKDIKWVEIVSEQSNGKLKNRKGEWRYLTAEMYDEVFFPQQRHVVSNAMGDREQDLTNESKMEKHKAQLKKMLFNPGQEIDNVPFIGDKMAIFSKEMIPYYNYRIFKFNWADSIPCIAFTCFVKEGMEDDVVIQDLTSYFREDSREVIARDYQLTYNTFLFDFDIEMKVVNELQDGNIVPVRIWYDGFWDVPFKKPEVINFELLNSDYDFTNRSN